MANVSATIILSVATKGLGWGQYNSMLIRSNIGSPIKPRKI